MEINKKLKLYQEAVNKIEKIEDDIYRRNVTGTTYDRINELIECLTDIIPDEKIIVLIRINKSLKKDLDINQDFRNFKKDVLNLIREYLKEKLNTINELINLIEVDYPCAAELQSYSSFKLDLRSVSREIKEFMEYLETRPRVL